MKLLDTDKLSASYRAKAVNLAERRLLITNFQGSKQEQDFTEPANCQGFGRVRHFRRSVSSGWPLNPLPIDPACRTLGRQQSDMIRAQVFQNAVCNWRCWYCFVDFNLLSANPNHSSWFTASELVDLYLAEPDRPPMLDLTGGQPDLVPEWVPWMLEELRTRGLEKDIYVWSDDNLSNDYFWRYLSESDREFIATYPRYGRVCCFKGFNAESFSFNTMANAELFEQQFSLMQRLLCLGLNLFAYVTFTCPSRETIREDMPRFVDCLQEISENLPLRTVPLEIRVFTPVRDRMDEAREQSLTNQYVALDAWTAELDRRFPSSIRQLPIVDIPMKGR